IQPAHGGPTAAPPRVHSPHGPRPPRGPRVDLAGYDGRAGHDKWAGRDGWANKDRRTLMTTPSDSPAQAPPARTPARRPIVVGVDGSPASWQAIHMAVWEARARRTTLVLAHGFPADPYTWYGWAPMYAGP